MIRPGRVNWVATPPPGGQPPARQRPRRRYAGPPAYPVPPRWGFPQITWRIPTSVPGTGQQPMTLERVRAQARNTSAMLWLAALGAVVSAGGEIWRYVLLVLGRTEALSAGVVNTSDALVVTASVITILVSLFAAVLSVLWLLRARQVAAQQAGHDPARPDWQVIVGVLVPGLNLVVPGSALAELEHAALARPALNRPRPSRLVLAWWLAWAVSATLFVVTLLWNLRRGVQAMADGVVLHAVTDLAAATVAVLTVFVVARLTVLLAPVDLRDVRLMRVIRVDGPPQPAVRPQRPATAAR